MSHGEFVKGQVFRGPKQTFVIHYVADPDRIVVRYRENSGVAWYELTMSALELRITLADHEAKEITL